MIKVRGTRNCSKRHVLARRLVSGTIRSPKPPYNQHTFEGVYYNPTNCTQSKKKYYKGHQLNKGIVLLPTVLKYVGHRMSLDTNAGILMFDMSSGDIALRHVVCCSRLHTRTLNNTYLSTVRSKSHFIRLHCIEHTTGTLLMPIFPLCHKDRYYCNC